MGSDYVFNRVKAGYSDAGARAFDVDFMSTVYERPFEVVKVDEEHFPEEKGCSLKIGGHLEGCRIGFGAGNARFYRGSIAETSVESRRGHQKKQTVIFPFAFFGELSCGRGVK